MLWYTQMGDVRVDAAGLHCSSDPREAKVNDCCSRTDEAILKTRPTLPATWLLYSSMDFVLA